MLRLEGKVAVVTGGNSGIGLATARRLRDEGAWMAISGRNRETLDEAVKFLGRDTVAVQADIAKLSDIDKLFSVVSQKLGKIDILFVNAGMAQFGPIENVSEKQYDEQFDVNTKGTYFTIQKALPHLNDGASIILNTSVASHKGRAMGSVYAAHEGGDAIYHAVCRSSAREPQHTCERCGPGPDPDTAFWPPGTVQGSGGGVCGKSGCGCTHETIRDTRRGCRNSGVSCVLGCILYNGGGNKC